jgi:hypothetical protein
LTALGPLYAPDAGNANEPLAEDPRAVLSHDRRGAALVAALWPSLWGSNLKDIWGIDAADPDYVTRLGLWAGRYLRPEGPTPPIRIGNQPYGVLPVTSLTRWDSSGDGFGIEGALRQHLLEARALWVNAAETTGTVTGADADKVLDLLQRTPVTPLLMATLHLPLEVAQLGMSSSAPPLAVLDWWRQQARLPRQLRGGEPARAFVQFLSQIEIPLPMVEPRKPTDPVEWIESPGRTLFERALRWFVNRFQARLTRNLFDFDRRMPLPESLLVRLLVHSAVTAASEVVRTGGGRIGPVTPSEGGLFDRLGAGTSVGDQSGTPAGETYERLWRSLRDLSTEDPRILERTFLATVDTASHRIDPWITAIAWRRLTSPDYTDAPRRLGAYGWVDRPFKGSRGPTSAGLLIAPSTAQAQTAVILRDKAVYDPSPPAGALPGTRRWDMTLDSARVRMADRIATEVRAGAHIGEVLGREVERIFPRKEEVERLRDRYRLHSANGGRRVCDGEKVLARTGAQLAAETGMTIRPDQEEKLEELREAIDAYGDLLVADAVFDVVSGRGETAGASMEAAAGLDLPPELDVIRTPRAGRALSTVLLGVLPAAAATANDRSPAWIAEPSIASHVRKTFPPAPSWAWTRADRSGSSSTTTTVVTLADLGLQPEDLLVLAPEQVATLVLNATSATATTAHPQVRSDGSGPILHARLRQLISALTGAPAVATKLTVDSHAVDAAEDAEVRDELWARYLILHQSASALLSALTTANAAAFDGATELFEACRWGIVPSPPSELSPAARRKALLQQAADVLAARVENAPAPDPAPKASTTIDAIAAAIVALTGASMLPVFSRIRRSQLASRKSGAPAPALTADPFHAMPLAGNPAAGTNSLDESWLQTVAAVRPVAARVESYQLHALASGWPPLRAWTNWPGNPWRMNLGTTVGNPETLVAVYGPSHAIDGPGDPVVAAVILDSWTETIPAKEHTVGAAFGFNAPAARAPQAILVAVTPVHDVPLDSEILRDILIETRQLAHARMATPSDLQPLAAALPATLVQSRYADAAGLELFPWEQA